jgi:subfamily B ATP-binding cassette protein MsbA
MGKFDATDEEINNAIKNACLDEFVKSLPNGINTQIGERGTLLSGGQKQRVAIARAFIKNAPIVILDEATSALDSDSELAIEKALSNIMKNKTVIAIAHRLSTLKNMDRIIVLDNGSIIEQGTIKELLKNKDGTFYHLYKLQTEGYL